jgi:hypothetical protein
MPFNARIKNAFECQNAEMSGISRWEVLRTKEVGFRISYILGGHSLTPGKTLPRVKSFTGSPPMGISTV